MSCITGCFGNPDEAACQFICQWEFGQSNEKYGKLLTCMGENGCLTMQPDGLCLGDSRYELQIKSKNYIKVGSSHLYTSWGCICNIPFYKSCSKSSGACFVNFWR